MTSSLIDIAGQQFGRLTAISYEGEKKWKCKCKCGSEVVISSRNLRSGKSTSCGCFQRETCKKLQFSHGKSSDLAYNVWKMMKQRCSNPKNPKYEMYGGRGIEVCDRWKNSFENFLDDMGNRPSKDHSIDRIDVNGNYEPSNCRWANSKIQASNKRSNVFFEVDGISLTAAQLSEIYGVPRRTIRYRIVELGWSAERASKTPVNRT